MIGAHSRIVLAHAGRGCSPSEALTTVAVMGVLAVALIRPWRATTLRTRATSSTACLVLVGALTLAGCGGRIGDDTHTTTSAASRPTTTVTLRIVRPAPNELTGPDTVAEIELVGGRVVPQTTGPLRPDEGHIHVSVDGKLVSMAYETKLELKGLTPGPHTLQAEFVAADHVPFRNRVTAAVIFEVKA